METGDQIQLFQEFFELNYQKEIVKASQKEYKYLAVDFLELAKFNPELADQVLEWPENTIKAAEIAIEQVDYGEPIKDFKVRFHNLPETQTVLIRNIRAKHLGKLIVVKGVVRQKSDVRPQTTSAKFECPACGNIIPILQLDQKFKEPSACGCGRKGKFTLLSKTLVDAQKIVVEESAEDLDGGHQPKRMNFFLSNDLTSPITDRGTNPGSNVLLIGVLKEIPVLMRDGGKSTRFDLMIDVNYVEYNNDDYNNLEISPEDEKEIKELSKNPKILDIFSNSLMPKIKGYQLVKKAITLQQFGGVSKTIGGVQSRGNTHILLIGDPGSGKTQILLKVKELSPKARYASGKGASGSGLTASVIKDDFIGTWAVEAGTLPLANKGIAIIDELDKMTKEDRSYMHEGLEQGTITVNKANIQATLKCDTTVLAAANPKHSRFDPYDTIFNQIDLPVSLVSRFDLIFPIRDLPNQEKDRSMARHILQMHHNPNILIAQQEIREELITKYIAYAKQKCEPVLTEDAMNLIEDFYVMFRNTEQGGDVITVPVTARQLEGVIRLAEASAKLRLSDTVDKEDATIAIELVKHCLTQIGLDPETGKIDVDRALGVTTANQRNNISIIKKIFMRLYGESSDKMVEIHELMNEAKKEGVREEKTDEIIEKLKREGEIYSPVRGKLTKM